MSTLTDYEALDTRMVFKAYAIAAWVTGTLLYGWGGLVFRAPLAGVPYSDAMAARMAGAVVIGAGFLAIAMARSHDDVARRRALGWWAVAHAVVVAGVGLQLWAVIGLEELGWGGLLAIGVPLGTASVLTHFWQTADGIPWGGLGLSWNNSLLEELRRTTVRRSTYEENIREAASQ